MSSEDGIKMGKNIALQKQIAIMSIAGMSTPAIMSELKLTKAQITRLTKDPAYRTLVETQLTAETGPSLIKAKTRLSKLVDEAVSAIERALKSGETSEELKAASMVLKASGMDVMEREQQDTNITVVLPGAESKEITLESNGESYVVQK